MGVVLERSGRQRSGEVAWPAAMDGRYRPPYRPARNSVAPVFCHLRQRRADTMDTTRDELQNALPPFWEHPPILLHLTGDPWWVEAFEHNRSSTS